MKRRFDYVPFSRANIYARDEYSCQSCGRTLPAGELTFDHVMPVAQGGRKDWENIVTCCVAATGGRAGARPRRPACGWSRPRGRTRRRQFASRSGCATPPTAGATTSTGTWSWTTRNLDVSVGLRPARALDRAAGRQPQGAARFRDRLSCCPMAIPDMLDARVVPPRAFEGGRVVVEAGSASFPVDALPGVRVGDVRARLASASSRRLVFVVPPGVEGPRADRGRVTTRSRSASSRSAGAIATGPPPGGRPRLRRRGQPLRHRLRARAASASRSRSSR